MASELIYTSVKRGLQSGTHGFCTVAMTRGLSALAIDRLEGLSGYRSCFPLHDPRAAFNPVNYSYYSFIISGRRYPVLSRIAFAGADYTGRSNKFAHHVAMDEDRLPESGPIHVAHDPGFFLHTWSGDPCWLETPKSIPFDRRPAQPARVWESVTGDAGWAGVVAEHTVASLGRSDAPVAILYPPEFGADRLLNLLEEAMALIPPDRRWDVTFSTYLTDMPSGTTCMWRCMLPDSPEWEKIRRNSAVLCIDLTATVSAAPTGGELVKAARSGADLYLAAARADPNPLAILREPSGGKRALPANQHFPPSANEAIDLVPTPDKGGSDLNLRSAVNPSTRRHTITAPLPQTTRREKISFVRLLGIFAAGVATGALILLVAWMRQPKQAAPSAEKQQPASLSNATNVASEDTQTKQLTPSVDNAGQPLTVITNSTPHGNDAVAVKSPTSQQVIASKADLAPAISTKSTTGGAVSASTSKPAPLDTAIQFQPSGKARVVPLPATFAAPAEIGGIWREMKGVGLLTPGVGLDAARDDALTVSFRPEPNAAPTDVLVRNNIEIKIRALLAPEQGFQLSYFDNVSLRNVEKLIAISIDMEDPGPSVLAMDMSQPPPEVVGFFNNATIEFFDRKRPIAHFRFFNLKDISELSENREATFAATQKSLDSAKAALTKANDEFKTIEQSKQDLNAQINLLKNAKDDGQTKAQITALNQQLDDATKTSKALQLQKKTLAENLAEAQKAWTVAQGDKNRAANSLNAARPAYDKEGVSNDPQHHGDR